MFARSADEQGRLHGAEARTPVNAESERGLFPKALFKKFCKRDFCDEVRDFKIPEPEAVAS